MTIVAVQYDLSPAEVDSKIRDKLREMGWLSPEEAQLLKLQCEAMENELAEAGRQLRVMRGG